MIRFKEEPSFGYYEAQRIVQNADKNENGVE